MWVPKGRSIYWCSRCKHEHIRTLNNGLPDYCPICGNDQYPIKMPKLNTKHNSDDFVSLVTSFCARIYGKRRTKRKAEQIIKSLERDDSNDPS